MPKTQKLTFFNDPIYGFIGSPNDLIFKLISHPYFQRLRRISQMGLSYVVYPGAHHTRFHHALGSMHLMTRAIQTLRWKQVAISSEEETGLLCAILLHDIGHGPFSHALEGFLVTEWSHEQLSLRFMEELNQACNGQLAMAIAIFKGEYPKPFMNQLVSGQLDMDRLDYLKRDSFYAGVTEGNINAERLIFMLNVVDGALVIEEKGIYAVEEFLMARRFMYWQVYLHKTGLAAEQVLVRIMERARELISQGVVVEGSKPLLAFLYNTTPAYFTTDLLETFAQLDDADILSALKAWQHHSDFVLRKMCQMVLHRELPHVKIRTAPLSPSKIAEKRDSVMQHYGISAEEAAYFVFQGKTANRVYNEEQQTLQILKKNGTLTHIVNASDQLHLQAVSKNITRYYSCYPKAVV